MEKMRNTRFEGTTGDRGDGDPRSVPDFRGVFQDDGTYSSLHCYAMVSLSDSRAVLPAAIARQIPRISHNTFV